MKVVFLAGTDTDSTRLSVMSVCRLASVEPVAIVLETGSPSIARRLANLRRNMRREGIPYVPYRALAFVADWLEGLTTRFDPVKEGQRLLRTVFPDRAFSLHELAARHGFSHFAVDNLNSPEAVEILQSLRAELGIVLGTRILHESTFSAPKLGCINLHKGAVPDYRGLPPGFWELYDGRNHAETTVHFIDSGLDTGDVIGTRRVEIHPRETEASLRTKLDREGAALLARCVDAISRQSHVRVPQRASGRKARTNPTRRQRDELRRRRPFMPAPPSATKRIAKAVFHLALFYSGVYHLVRRCRRLMGRSRAVILLYHRVNDFSSDVLTASTGKFADHLVMLRQKYEIRDTSWLLQRLENNEGFAPNTVIVHFDDCYRDVRTNAAPLLQASGAQATAFIASGFIDSSRPFEHDMSKSPFSHENLSAVEVRELRSMGFGIGAHTVNHANLGRIPLADVRFEVLRSRSDLEQILGTPVDLFSFPFGRISDISEEARAVLIEAGFRAVFSAYGGAATPGCNLFDIPRMGVSSDFRCLDLMMEIEGISLGSWRSRISKRTTGV